MKKTNIEFLRGVIEKMELEPTEEALEFLDAIEQEFKELADEKEEVESEKKELEDEITGLKNQVEELEVTTNKNFVGLDTIRWHLEKGNLKIQMQMERFIEALQEQNCVSITA